MNRRLTGGQRRIFQVIDPAPIIEARRRWLIRIDMSADPLPPKCQMLDSTDGSCGNPAVVGLKRPDSLVIVYVCARHINIGERSLI